MEKIEMWKGNIILSSYLLSNIEDEIDLLNMKTRFQKLDLRIDKANISLEACNTG